MTLTTFPATTDPSDLAALNLSRLVDRLEFNILSPNADLKPLRRSEYQRIRVGVVCSTQTDITIPILPIYTQNPGGSASISISMRGALVNITIQEHRVRSRHPSGPRAQPAPDQTC